MVGMPKEHTPFFDTQNMQKIGSKIQPLGICRRLINFIIGLLSRSMTPGSEEVPDEPPATKNGKSSDMSLKKPDGYSDSEIGVEFRHTTSSGSWRQIDELGELIHSPDKDGLILSHDQAIQRKGFEKKEISINHSSSNIDHSSHKRNGKKARGEGLLELEPLTPMDDGRNIPVNGEIVIEETNGALADEATKSHDQHHEPRLRRRFGPLFSVASNINEKSDAFISSRKEAMQRDYTPDPENP